ncbi:MAG: histidine kinase [Flavobacteriaceae bacterium]|nr:histidine kinase [Flavobacteriaceae bacterium]
MKNTIVLNVGAFVLVTVLEILSIWVIKDKFDTDYEFYMHGISYAVNIMLIIWINHFALIPWFLDRRRYLRYGILLMGCIFLASYFRGYAKGGWPVVSKFFFFLIYTTGTGMAAFLLRRNAIIQRENAEKDKLQKELALNYLKEQVNPHFLFNSLNSIYSLSRQQSPETPTVVMQLSELMRYQLESAKKDFVSVKEELEFIENYLLLEEKRLGERCTIEFSIEGELADEQIAPMLLIPFVENAVKHGAQLTNAPSTIDVSAQLKNDALFFNVINSKPAQTPLSNREGTGLDNVKRRLALLYPHAHDLKIEDLDHSYHVALAFTLKNALS